MFHLRIKKIGQRGRGSAMPRLAYIRRTRRYANRGDVVRIVQSLNLPHWANNSAEDFWQAVDSERTRVNACPMYTAEFAIPRVLTATDQTALVSRFCRQLSRSSAGRCDKTNLPVSFGIHEGVRRDDAETGRAPNPHAHVLISTSINDCVERPRQQWFRRYDAKCPGRGGAPRSSYIGTRHWLWFVRKAWARFANAALVAAGFPPSLDARSYRARGIDRLPTMHLGPLAAQADREGILSLRGEANRQARKQNDKLDADRADAIEMERRMAKAVEASETLLEDLDRERRNAEADLSELLGTHPFKQSGPSILDKVTLALFRRDSLVIPNVGGLLLDLGKSTYLETLLGPDWLLHQAHGVLWLMLPPRDQVIAIENDIIRTDSSDANFMYAMACAAESFELKEVVRSRDESVNQLFEETLKSRGLELRWVQRKERDRELGRARMGRG